MSVAAAFRRACKTKAEAFVYPFTSRVNPNTAMG
jgi:hypothetical protein